MFSSLTQHRAGISSERSLFCTNMSDSLHPPSTACNGCGWGVKWSQTRMVIRQTCSKSNIHDFMMLFAFHLPGSDNLEPCSWPFDMLASNPSSNITRAALGYRSSAQKGINFITPPSVQLIIPLAPAVQNTIFPLTAIKHASKNLSKFLYRLVWKIPNSRL